MGKRFSELELLNQLLGIELLAVSLDGSNYAITFNDLKSSIGKEDIGLSRVDNTSDAEKPISLAVSNALGQRAPLVHTHEISNITGLQDILNDKADVFHTHSIGAINGLEAIINTKSNIGHTHGISDVSGLSATLNSKSNVGHGHVMTDVSGLLDAFQVVESTLNGKANTIHTHLSTDITDFEERVQLILEEGGIISGDVTVGDLEW